MLFRGHTPLRHSNLLRERAVDELCEKAREIIKKYIKEKNQDWKMGWQEQAQVYLDQELPQMQESGSLFALKQSLLDFSETLRSTYNSCASYFLSQESLKYLSGYVGGGGSTLKEKLVSFASDIEPRQAQYVLNEITIKDQIYKIRCGPSHYPISVDPMKLLSEEGKRTLEAMIALPDGEQLFRDQSNQFRRRIIVPYTDEYILDHFYSWYAQKSDQTQMARTHRQSNL